VDPAEGQRIRFCTTDDGVRIAYAVCGHGPALVKTAHWLSHVEYDWDSPVWRPWLRFLSRHRTFVRYDPRGCGLSDRDVDDVSQDGWMRDLEAVVRDAGLTRYELLGMSQGGPVAIQHARRAPHAVTRLVLYGAYARGRLHRGLPPAEKVAGDALPHLIRTGWGRANPAFRQLFTSLFLPGGSAEQVAWFNELQRRSATPETAARIVAACDDLDVTEAASELRLPTLVLHARGDARVPVDEGRLLAALIPDAAFVELDSENHVLLEEEAAWATFRQRLAAFLELPPEADTRSAARPRAELTARERDVLALVAEGLENKAIARRLGLAPKTVRNYVSNVLSKVGAATRTEAAATWWNDEAQRGADRAGYTGGPRGDPPRRR
jgi:pimeloyl-ACP methyl ester carboxylesterase/DNA-binding CsgD family transcriptional regulator